MTDGRADDDSVSVDGTADGHPKSARPPSDSSTADGQQREEPESEDSADGDDETALPDAMPDVGGFDSLDDVIGTLRAVGTRRAVVAITVVALLARLVGLGARPMHYDEARVGYWVLHYVESGAFTYRHGIHGPFIQHVDSWLFPLLGSSDFVARLPVAIAGGLLPLVALAFRNYLRKAETVAVALFLGFNSILLYYSRFMRSDVLLAAFMFGAFAFLVRFYDTRDVRYLYGVAALAAFGFAAKENAIVYVLTWVGAAGLLADQALYRPRAFRSGADLLKTKAVRWYRNRRRMLKYGGHIVGAFVVFLAILVFMYADRGAGMAGIRRPPVPPGKGAVGFWEALSNPVGFPGYALDTLVTATNEALQWGGRTGAGESESLIDTYLSHLGGDLKVLWSNARVVVIFAVLGFLWERYGRETSRNLVLFAAYCGFVSILGYPLADDIGSAHWLHVHIVVPLAIPAAVAAGGIYRWGRSASADRDTVVTAAAAFILLFAGLQGALLVGSDVYGDTTSRDNPLAQYAQPESDFKIAANGITEIARTDPDGADVVLYTGADYSGSRRLVSPPGSSNHSFILRPACSKTAWYNAIPLNWYLTKADADVECATNPGRLAELASEQQPPVIVTLASDDTVPRNQLSGSYVGRTFDVYQFGHRFTIYLHEDRVDEVAGWTSAGDAPST